MTISASRLGWGEQSEVSAEFRSEALTQAVVVRRGVEVGRFLTRSYAQRWVSEQPSPEEYAVVVRDV